MRRLSAAALVLFLWPLHLLVAAAPARAQVGDVELLLRSQTASASPDRPMRIRVRAVNSGQESYEDLSIVLRVFPAARSRSEYLESLETSAPTALRTVTLEVPGTLEPGQTRAMPRLKSRLRELAQLKENALYPLEVQLLSGGVPIADLHTALAFIRQRPLVPLNVSVVFVLDHPVAVRPDGVLEDSSLERTIAPGGRLRRVTDALAESPVAVTLAVSPLLLRTLERMGTGYRVAEDGAIRAVAASDPGARRARAFLDGLREIARDFRSLVVALPYASPSIPALAQAGLQQDLERHLARGRAVVEEVLGEPPAPSIIRPPGSVLSPEGLDALALAELDAVVLDAETLPPRPGLKFSPSPTAPVATDLGNLRAVTPDLGVDQMLGTLGDDPRLRAEWVLGLLSAIYFERPGLDRGVAILFDENDAPASSFLRALLGGLARPRAYAWLEPVTVARMLSGDRPGEHRRQLGATSNLPRFSDAYVASLRDVRDDLEQMAATAAGAPLVSRLSDLILASESRFLMDDELQAMEFHHEVRRQVGREFSKVRPPASSSVTLTSQRGVIPVTIRSGARYDMRVRLTLESPARLRFLGGPSRDVVLSRPVQAFTFPVRAATTGRFPVTVVVQTPLGTEITDFEIVVRSTAYNRVALLVTIGAALFLAVWWGRRFFSRTR